MHRKSGRLFLFKKRNILFINRLAKSNIPERVDKI